jgi:hypothetical protein
MNPDCLSSSRSSIQLKDRVLDRLFEIPIDSLDVPICRTLLLGYSISVIDEGKQIGRIGWTR